MGVDPLPFPEPEHAPVASEPTRVDRPFFWRVAPGVLYAEMPYLRTVRPPLLGKWESDRVLQFRNRERRSQWLAGRALAKAVVRERLGVRGLVEIREGRDGEPLVYRDGFPMSDVWLGIAVRHGRACCVLADRPASLEVRQVDADGGANRFVDGFVSRSELRTLRRAVGSSRAARSVGWAAKEAGLRVARRAQVDDLRSVAVDGNLAIVVGDMHLHLLAARVVDDVAVAIVGRSMLSDRHVSRIVLDDGAREAATPRVQAALERSMVAARRHAESLRRIQPNPGT